MKLPVYLGSNDGIQVWFNGKNVLANNIARKAEPEQEVLTLDFQKGNNQLLLKISNQGASHGFYFSMHRINQLSPDEVTAIWSLLERDFPEQIDQIRAERADNIWPSKPLNIDAKTLANRYTTAIAKIPKAQEQAKTLSAKVNDFSDLDNLRELYYSTRKHRSKALLEGPLADIDEIIFATRKPGDDIHWYANFSYYAEDSARLAYRPNANGKLCKLNIKTGKLETLIDDPEGSIRDPQVNYDGEKIIFSYRKAQTKSFYLYQINTDGTGLKQLTTGPDGRYDDFEPTYLPDGSIMFVSSRCNRWVNCWLTQVANLHRCDADGQNIRQVSANIEQDNTPWPLPDGRVLFQRWEYIDRSQVHYHHLWTVNPDGTGQMVYYGNLHPDIVMIDAKPIPNTEEQIVAVFSPGHGRREHAGRITILSQKTGPDDRASAKTINPDESFRDPYPISKDAFLVAKDHQILFMDGDGHTEKLYSLDEDLVQLGVQCHEPRPIKTRRQERIIPDRIQADHKTGKFFLMDVYQGRNMQSVERGDIKKLLIIETLPKPINYTGGMEPLSYGGTFTLEQVLGTVPVEPDGSAYFEVPAMRSIFFIALDQNNNSIKRMQSFTNVMPGETTGCIGCHEHRTQSPVNPGQIVATAIKRPASKIEPIQGIPDVFDFPRDIQPILDKHCVPCHGTRETQKGGPRAGDVLLTGDHGPIYSHSYFMLTAKRQIADGRNLAKSNYPPRKLGASASPLMHKIENNHHRVKLSKHEKNMVRFWIESAAPYPGTYAALGSGMIGGYRENQVDISDRKWPEMKAKIQAMKKRCHSCHNGPLSMPLSPSTNMGMPSWEVKYGTTKLQFSRHIIYNLSKPTESLLLLAPLAKQAGGYGICRVIDPNGKITDQPANVFANTNDNDYGIILAAIDQTKQHLEKIKRFDMAGFQPPKPYVREMKRYGILPKDLPEDSKIDIYATDRAYWKSHWWKPQ
jgi:hypothetical protein